MAVPLIMMAVIGLVLNRAIVQSVELRCWIRLFICFGLLWMYYLVQKPNDPEWQSWAIMFFGFYGMLTLGGYYIFRGIVMAIHAPPEAYRRVGSLLVIGILFVLTGGLIPPQSMPTKRDEHLP